MRLKIVGGRLFDPAQGWNGEVREVHIAQGRIVAHLSEVDRVLDARGQAVVPGGIDLRGQVATYGLNFLRLWGELPSPAALGQAYASLGYTHVHEPLLTPATAGEVHRELTALPVVDTSASLVLNCRDFDLWLQDPARLPELAETVLFLLEQSRSLQVRVVEPWVRHRQDYYAHRTLGTAATLEILGRLAGLLGLSITVEASREVLETPLPEPTAFHLAALGAALSSAALADAALAHLERGVTGDMGLVYPRLPGGGNGVPVRVDLGGFQPLDLAPPRDRERARLALGLALQHRGANLAFSGAGGFQGRVTDYSRFFAWLLDREARQAFWGEPDTGVSLTFQDWVYATRTLPAKLLGLTHLGHLGTGARADVALFDLPAGKEATFWPGGPGPCRTLLKAGAFVVQDFSPAATGIPKTTWYRKSGAEPTGMSRELCQARSFRPEHLGVSAGLTGSSWTELDHGQP